MVDRPKIIFLSLLSLIFASGLFVAGGIASAEPDKEYRSGQVIAINNKIYLIANNKEFAEIIEIKADNKLVQVSEVRGMDMIEDLYAGKAMNKYFLIIATGQYLYRYDISDPAAPRIEFKRDLYVFKRGQFRIGSVNALAGNKDFLFGAGSNGARSFFLDNLFLNKIYAFDKSYGLAADENYLAIITEAKGTVYNILSGAKLVEVDLENKDKLERTPTFDSLGNAYFPTDRGLVKVNIYNGEKKIYNNPVPRTETFSYGASARTDGSVYYVNGHGVTVFDKNFNKVKFINTAKGGQYGLSPWAVGLSAAASGGREANLVLNKSSILLLDKNLKVSAVYKYKKSYPDFITTKLNLIASLNIAAAGQKINLRLFGFWPNENVKLTFGQAVYNLKVDNQGYASADITVPQQNTRQAIIQATGSDSKFNYQTTFTIL